MTSDVVKKRKVKKEKYSCEELLMMNVEDIYKLLLDRKILRFPMGLWIDDDCKENAIKCTRYLIEDILKWDYEDIKNKLRLSVFTKYKLGGMLQKVYKNSPYECINDLYPKKFKPWELHEAKSNYWKSKDNRIVAVKWLLEEKNNFNRKAILKNTHWKLFKDNDLGGLLTEAKGSIFSLIEEAYPGEFKPWEFEKLSVEKLYWDKKENRLSALKWLIEDTLKLNEKNVAKKVNAKDFIENGLSTLFTKEYSSSIYRAINELYPNKFRVWEVSIVEDGYWENRDNVEEAVKWMLEEKLKWSKEDIIENLTQKTFARFGLSGLISNNFNGQPWKLLDIAYPGEFKPWELKKTSVGFWSTKENRIKALDWLVFDVLKINKNSASKILTQNILIDNKLRGLLLCGYDGSMKKLREEYFNN